MCNKSVHNYAHAVKFIPDWCKTQEMCIKLVDDYLSAIKFVPECYDTH